MVLTVVKQIVASATLLCRCPVFVIGITKRIRCTVRKQAVAVALFGIRARARAGARLVFRIPRA